MRNKLLFSVVLFLLCLLHAQAANHWDKRSAVGGSKRERGICFSIGNRGYIGLGQDTLNQMLNDFWEYDPGTNTWTQKSNFPGAARRDAAAFSIGTKGYVGTGMNNADAAIGNPVSDFWEYNPATNSWSSKASFPGNGGTGIYYSTGFAVGGKGYLCCGKIGPSYYSNELWEYNPGSNSWLQKAYLPGVVRYGGSAFTIGNYAYYGFGTDENMFDNDFYRYDPASNTWTTLANFPGSPRFNGSTFVLYNYGYLVFGSDGGYKDELWQYDPSIDYWYAKASFPGGARRSAAAFAINNRGFAGTGKGLSGTRRDFWEYIPTLPASVDELNRDELFTMYPNPMSESCSIQLAESLFAENELLLLDLYSVEGKLIQSESLVQEHIQLPRNSLPSGNYLVCIRNGYEQLASKILIVQ